MLKLIASVVSVVALMPWLVLGLIAMGAVIRWASLGHLSVADSILIGIAVLVVRQFWTVQMGMRGLVVTDMVQGIVAYIGSAVLCLGLLLFYFKGLSNLGQLNETQLSLPAFGSESGGWYYFGIVAAGIIGSLCWPMIFTRIYTAGSVREVKKGTLQTMVIGFVFFVPLMAVALCAASMPFAAKDPVSAFFAICQDAGGTWLLAFGLLVVFAASMGFVEGVTQAIGTQVANDIIGVIRPLRDKQELYLAKGASRRHRYPGRASGASHGPGLNIGDRDATRSARIDSTIAAPAVAALRDPARHSDASPRDLPVYNLRSNT
jgi:Na+/proline symporter